MHRLARPAASHQGDAPIDGTFSAVHRDCLYKRFQRSGLRPLQRPEPLGELGRRSGQISVIQALAGNAPQGPRGGQGTQGRLDDPSRRPLPPGPKRDPELTQGGRRTRVRAHQERPVRRTLGVPGGGDHPRGGRGRRSGRGGHRRATGRSVASADPPAGRRSGHRSVPQRGTQRRDRDRALTSGRADRGARRGVPRSLVEHVVAVRVRDLGVDVT